jgi:hypothetical protein
MRIEEVYSNELEEYGNSIISICYFGIYQLHIVPEIKGKKSSPGSRVGDKIVLRQLFKKAAVNHHVARVRRRKYMISYEKTTSQPSHQVPEKKQTSLGLYVTAQEA